MFIEIGPGLTWHSGWSFSTPPSRVPAGEAWIYSTNAANAFYAVQVFDNQFDFSKRPSQSSRSVLIPKRLVEASQRQISTGKKPVNPWDAKTLVCRLSAKLGKREVVAGLAVLASRDQTQTLVADGDDYRLEFLLSPGQYRAELVLGNEVLDSQEYRVVADSDSTLHLGNDAKIE